MPTSTSKAPWPRPAVRPRGAAARHDHRGGPIPTRSPTSMAWPASASWLEPRDAAGGIVGQWPFLRAGHPHGDGRRPAGGRELRDLLEAKACWGLAEMMNYPGVIAGSRDVLAKLAAFASRKRDGHAPGLTGSSSTPMWPRASAPTTNAPPWPEAAEKLSRGLYILIRQATNAHNLARCCRWSTPGQQPALLFLHRRPPAGRSAGSGQHRPHGAHGHCLWHRPGVRASDGDPQQR
jgi:hypothetical protein